jgi:L-2-hydroxyglutarate oxidase LhgO
MLSNLSFQRFEVTGIDADSSKGVTLQSRAGEEVKAKWLITCGGLQADYVGRMAGGAKGPTILPFRGNYHELKPEYRSIVTRNIYPVPDPKFVKPRSIPPSSFLSSITLFHKVLPVSYFLMPN